MDISGYMSLMLNLMIKMVFNYSNQPVRDKEKNPL